MINIFRSKTSFIKIVEDIEQGIIDGTLLKPDGDKYVKSSAGAYQYTIHWLKIYEADREKIYLEKIDLEWIEDFILFLMQTNLAKNSVANLLAAVKAVLNRMHDQGLCSLDSSCIRIENELTTAVYNTEEELDLLLDLDLSQEHALQLVRDAYVIQCSVGLRFSDLKKLLFDIKSYIRKEGDDLYFEIKTKKTKANVAIPISSIVKEILARNNYNFKKKLDNKFYNSAIKIIAERAGINNEILFSRTQGGRRVDTVRIKSSLLSSHTARRSFATNAFLAGIPVLNIMQMTGHSTQSSFFRYVRCSSMEAAIKISDHPFFDISLEKETELLPELFSPEYTEEIIVNPILQNVISPMLLTSMMPPHFKTPLFFKHISPDNRAFFIPKIN